jgi:hypothetical protein
MPLSGLGREDSERRVVELVQRGGTSDGDSGCAIRVHEALEAKHQARRFESSLDVSGYEASNDRHQPFGTTAHAEHANGSSGIDGGRGNRRAHGGTARHARPRLPSPNFPSWFPHVPLLS